MSVALVAPLGTALAAPQSVRQPAMRPVDDRGLLDSVANKSSQLITQVRDGASGLVDSAMNFLGVRYKLGGNTAETGFDCSGFTRYVFAHFGVSLPHYTFAQFDLGRRVARSGLRPGDLVFFDGVGHVGLYIGHDRFIHAPHTVTRVSVDRLSGWYSGRYAGARRVIT
jgi:cell wall-associated NlpC family hydrolase